MIRKNSLIGIALVFALIIPKLFAQIGFKGGPALSDIVFADKGQTPYLSYEINSLTHRLPYLTYQFGVFKSFSLNNRLSIQPEILFVKKGLNYSLDFIYDDITYIIKIHYVEVPILIKLYLNNNKRSAILLGPYFSYMINNKRIRKIDGVMEKDYVSNINKTDFGFAGSFAFDFKNRFNLDFRVTYSLNEMMKYLDSVILDYYGPGKERARNVNLSLTVGYYLQLGNNK